MEHHEKNFENALRLALAKERLHSYSASRGHGTGKTYEIKGMRALLFFALADYIGHHEIRDMLGSANSRLLPTNLYSATVSEKAGICAISRAIWHAIDQGTMSEVVFAHLNRWIGAYSTMLDVIPTLSKYMANAELKHIQDSRLAPWEITAIKQLGTMMDHREPDRFARFTNASVREDGKLAHYLITGFPSSVNPTWRPVDSDQLEALAEGMLKIQNYLKLYERIAIQATPTPAPTHQRQGSRRDRFTR